MTVKVCDLLVIVEQLAVIETNGSLRSYKSAQNVKKQHITASFH